jgi:hypothetical protein
LILSFALIGGAQAAQLSEPDNTPFQGVYGQNEASVTRAQVQAELQQARANGQTALGDTDNTPFAAVAGSDNGNTQVAAQAQGSSTFGDPDNVPFQGA